MRYRELFESFTLPDSVMNQAIVYLKQMINQSDDGGRLIALMMGCRDDPYDDDTDQECFDSELPHWCENAIDDAFYEITSKFKNNHLQIYRVITAPPDWKPDPNTHPGIYWSYDPHAAEAHWGNFSNEHVKWILSASVTFDQIDWASTLSQNAIPDYDQEKEIRVYDVPIRFTYTRK